jgi:hypothetical protein
MSEYKRSLLSALSHNPDITVKPADKGGATVLLTTNNYNTEALRQLQDPHYYRTLDLPLTTTTHQQLTGILLDMRDKLQIDRKQFDYVLRPINQCKSRTFYLLPKIHKPIDKWLNNLTPPGRPIVSDVDSVTYYSAKLITQLLTPFPPTLASFVLNSQEFVNKIRGQPLPTSTLLVTADIDSLYTNMDPTRCISVTREYLLNYYHADLVNNVLKLLHLNLSCNDFKFNELFYLQTFGVAMGKSFAPPLASLYLAHFDACAINYTSKPRLFTRYIDDIFFLWDHGADSLTAFQFYLNSVIPGIKLTFTSNPLSIDFLDSTVFVDNGTLLTKVFFKPTDRRTLLSMDSFHPGHTHKGILKSQFIRYKRLCSKFSDYIAACDSLIYILINKGYKSKKMHTLANYIWYRYTGSGSDTTSDPDPTYDNSRLFFPLTYCAAGVALTRECQQLVLDHSSGLLRTVAAWRANRSIRQLVKYRAY